MIKNIIFDLGGVLLNLTQVGIMGSETLFIDDNKENVEKAQKVGKNAVMHDPQNEIFDSLENYLSQFNS